MGASNFMSENKTGIYAIELDESDNDQMIVKDLQDTILEDLKAMGLDVQEIDALPSDDNHNYSGWCFGLISGNWTKYLNYVTVELITRNGYHSGANLDYTFTYMVNGEEYAPEDLDSAWTYSERLQDYTTISKTEVKRLEANARAIEKKIAKVFKNNTMKLNRVGTFSNGETVYEVSK